MRNSEGTGDRAAQPIELGSMPPHRVPVWERFSRWPPNEIGRLGRASERCPFATGYLKQLSPPWGNLL